MNKPVSLGDWGSQAVWSVPETVYSTHISCVLPVWPHTFSVNHGVKAVTLERETLKQKKILIKKAPRFTPVLKSQFHSGSSIALTRSGWQQEFVSPPNLEITFSAAGRGPPSFPLSFLLLSLQPCQSGSLLRGNEPRPAYSVEIMSTD